MVRYDARLLARAIRTVCRPLGRIEHIELVPDEQGDRVLCRLRLPAGTDHRPFVERFGGFVAANCVCFFLDPRRP